MVGETDAAYEIRIAKQEIKAEKEMYVIYG